MMRFIARHRHIITAIIAILSIGGLIYLGVRMQGLKNENTETDTFTGIAMGTAVKKTIYSESTAKSEEINKAVDRCLSDLENQISVRVMGSEVAVCNSMHTVDGLYNLSDNLMEYLRQEMEIYKESNGAFSPCIRPITALWGIEEGETEVPEASLIEATLKNTNPVNIELREDGIVFHGENMLIDFGAVGKGIACDEIISTLAGMEVQGAVISVGGSIVTYGDKGDGKGWRIGIRDPRGEEGDVLGILNLKGNKMISTSGDYEKYFEAGGKRYHHIFDPATGYPAESGLISVTIISDSGFLSDALSTACFVMGLEDGMAYAEQKGVDAIFVTLDKEVYVTKGIKKNFNLRADEYKLKK